MNRGLAVFVIVVLLGLNGYTWYHTWAGRAAFEKRESDLVEGNSQLETQVAALQAERDSLSAENEVLNRRLADTRLSVGKLRRKSGLEQRFHRSYPQLAESDWGVVEVYDEKSRRYEEYMVVPLWLSETFIIDHENAALSSRCMGRG